MDTRVERHAMGVRKGSRGRAVRRRSAPDAGHEEEAPSGELADYRPQKITSASMAQLRRGTQTSDRVLDTGTARMLLTAIDTALTLR